MPPVEPQPEQRPASPGCQAEAQLPPEGAAQLTDIQRADLQDQGKQAEYRRQYLLQLEQRRGCPGCGD